MDLECPPVVVEATNARDYRLWRRAAGRQTPEAWLRELANAAARDAPINASEIQPDPSEGRCVHCGGKLEGKQERVCAAACSMRAYRRRKAGLPENAAPAGSQGRRLASAA